MGETKILQSENSRTLLTVSKKLEECPRKFNQFLASTLACLSAMCMGMCLVWTSPALPMLANPSTYPEITLEEGAWIGSLLTLGACIGAIPAGTIANLIGRKLTLQFLSIPFLVSWVIIAYGQTVAALYAARFLAGVACGGVTVAAPMYVAELAHSSIRGTLGTFFQVFVTIGILLEYFLGAVISSFHFLALASLAFPLIFLLTFSFMPETPVYLFSKRKIQASRNSLEFFRGSHFNTDEELRKIAEEITASQDKANLGDLFRSKATLNALVLSIGLMAFQQLSGINAVLFYTAHIFAETGSSISPDTCAIIVGLVQVIATMLSTLLIDRAGRKILLLLSSSIMCLSLVSLGTYFQLKENLTFMDWFPLPNLAIYIITFSIGFGPVPWIILGEIFTPQTKGVASSVSCAINWILAFTVTNQYQHLNNSVGTGITFYIFGCICAIATVFVLFLLPETKGRDIGEVQALLSREPTLKSNPV